MSNDPEPRIPLTIERRLQILHSLGEQKCSCGAAKRKGLSFCMTCYGSLPRELQRRLYRRFASGYEEAFEDALCHLSEGRLP